MAQFTEEELYYKNISKLINAQIRFLVNPTQANLHNLKQTYTSKPIAEAAGEHINLVKEEFDKIKYVPNHIIDESRGLGVEYVWRFLQRTFSENTIYPGYDTLRPSMSRVEGLAMICAQGKPGFLDADPFNERSAGKVLEKTNADLLMKLEPDEVNDINSGTISSQRFTIISTISRLANTYSLFGTS